MRKQRTPAQQALFSLVRAEIIRSTACSKCGADKGDACKRVDGTYRYTLHRERRAIFNESLRNGNRSSSTN